MKTLLSLLLLTTLAGCASTDKTAAAKTWADYDARVAADRAQQMRQIGK